MIDISERFDELGGKTFEKPVKPKLNKRVRDFFVKTWENLPANSVLKNLFRSRYIGEMYKRAEELQKISDKRVIEFCRRRSSRNDDLIASYGESLSEFDKSKNPMIHAYYKNLVKANEFFPKDRAMELALAEKNPQYYMRLLEDLDVAYNDFFAARERAWDKGSVRKLQQELRAAKPQSVGTPNMARVAKPPVGRV